MARLSLSGVTFNPAAGIALASAGVSPISLLYKTNDVWHLTFSCHFQPLSSDILTKTSGRRLLAKNMNMSATRQMTFSHLRHTSDVHVIPQTEKLCTSPSSDPKS
jgi:hypothetical protein